MRVAAGCLDALLNAYDQRRWWQRCGGRGECAHDGMAAEQRARRLVAEVARVLHPEVGVLVLVSYEPPEGRLSFLDGVEHGWTVCVTLDEEKGNYVYVCRKGEKESKGDGGVSTGGGGGSSDAGGGGPESMGDEVDLDALD